MVTIPPGLLKYFKSESSSYSCWVGVGFLVLTLGCLTISDHEGSCFVPGDQQLSLCVLPAHALKKPSEEEQETGLLLQQIDSICLYMYSIGPPP